jgi:protein SCO1/2
MLRRFAPWIAVAVACLFLAVVIAWRPSAPGTSNQAAIGGNFHLVDQSGRAVDQTILKGKWTAVFFGYTYCPDVCPTTLATLGTAADELGAKARDFQVVFVTVDPHRDTPAKLKAYLSSGSFPRGAIGLTGTDQQVAQAANAYKVYVQKQGAGADYSVDHSSAIYLMNPDGRFDSVIPYGLTPDQTRDALLKAMTPGRAS